MAIANPKLAPYGVAAMQTLKSLNLDSTIQSKLVYGSNVSHAFQLSNLGGDAGLVSHALVLLKQKKILAGIVKNKDKNEEVIRSNSEKKQLGFLLGNSYRIL